MSSKTSFRNVVLAIHGGADISGVTAAAENRYYAALKKALTAGYKILLESGTSLDAVVAAVKILEDCPLFNAGRGSVFTEGGHIEMDAAIMDGSNKKAGAVVNVWTVKNPITAARAVMDNTRHVLLFGKGAEQFAAESGLTLVDPEYFWTEKSKSQWQKMVQSANTRKNNDVPVLNNHRFGTVGAVALDSFGNLAAATSTGGIVGKRYGRCGDSPIIGAGTYADNETCAISCTGDGEFFIRATAAYDIAARMKYKASTLAQSVKQVIQGSVKKLGGEGGIIALDAKGNCVQDFNCNGMFRGRVTRNGEISVAIYR